MGRVSVSFLGGPGQQLYLCTCCGIHLADSGKIVSKQFRGRQGKAYLFDEVVNVSVGELEDRLLMTGMHTVADIYCNNCATVVGWKYERAFPEDQAYKEGKFIIEKANIRRGSTEQEDDEAMML